MMSAVSQNRNSLTFGFSKAKEAEIKERQEYVRWLRAALLANKDGRVLQDEPEWPQEKLEAFKRLVFSDSIDYSKPLWLQEAPPEAGTRVDTQA